MVGPHIRGLQKKIMILVCLLILGIVIVGYVSSYFVWAATLVLRSPNAQRTVIAKKNRRAYFGACIPPGNSQHSATERIINTYRHLLFVVRSSSVTFKLYSITYHLRYVIETLMFDVIVGSNYIYILAVTTPLPLALIRIRFNSVHTKTSVCLWKIY